MTCGAALGEEPGPIRQGWGLSLEIKTLLQTAGGLSTAATMGEDDKQLTSIQKTKLKFQDPDAR